MLTATVRSQASGLSTSANTRDFVTARANASITTSSASTGSPVTPVSCPTSRRYDVAYTSRTRPVASTPASRHVLVGFQCDDSRAGRAVAGRADLL